jgi:hypothetical protein
MPGQAILGWRLDESDREALLERFPPRYARTIADHVTFGPADCEEPMPEASHATIIGRADDGEGVEALVVALCGTRERPTGGTYHITWSLEPGREAIESNDVIARGDWEEVDGFPRVRLREERWQG